VKERALSLGLSVVQPATLRTPEAKVELRERNPTVLVLAAYGLLLPTSVLDVAHRGGLNIHPSLLPRHRGPAPVVGTILAGDEEAGVTVFLMDAGMDTGPILSQRHVALLGDEAAGELTARLAHEGASLVVETLRRWLRNEIDPVPQEAARATNSRLLRKGDGEIDFARPAVELGRRVRAMNPWPGAFTHLAGRRLGILRAQVMQGDEERHRPGEVVQTSTDASAAGPMLGVATGEGILGLVEVQMEGRRAMTAEEFLRGRRDFLGTVLPS
jgi:methionyl-tRNA formyltransferase